MEKSADAYRTISEAAQELKLPQHVLRFWETRFAQLKPLKRGGGRRFYGPEDMDLLLAIKTLLYGEGYTIKGVQRILKEQGARAMASLAQSGAGIVRGGEGAVAGTKQSVGVEPSGIAWMDGSDEPSQPEAGTHPNQALDASVSGELKSSGGGDGLETGCLPDAAVTRLRTVLFDLLECDRILAVARS